jgi:hypothetical protein
MSRKYAKAQRLINDPFINARDLLQEIAQLDPGVVIDGYKRLVGVVLAWEDACLPLLRLGKRREAIGLCLQLTGLTLSEAEEEIRLLEKAFEDEINASRKLSSEIRRGT